MTAVASAFDVLAELAQSARPGGTELSADAGQQWNGIGFSLFGEHFIAPVGEISEMLEIPPATRLPGVQPWVVGVANVRGRLLPIFDMAEFFGGKLGGNRRQHRVLILERDNIYAGLVVEQVLGMQHFAPDSHHPEANGKHAPMQHCLVGSYRLPEGDWQVFSTAKLIEDPRFANAARG